ncbi:MAG: polyprenyl synthetase family protein [Luteolibacter sp.]
MDLQDYLATRASIIDAALDQALPKATVRPAVIHRAMRHSVFAGGKRLRPILCLAAAEAFGGGIEDAMPAACAVELLHTYSLVHDDLPAMDDDDLRRGRPTCHKVFGEAIGILCGDALLTESFAVLAAAQPTSRHSVAAMMRELARAGDSRRMIGGQVLDLEAENQPATRASLKRIHEAKTAALLTASLRLGAMTANATPRALEALTAFGHALGHAFQVIDDILDETATTEQLGKTAGKDAAAAKATYPAVIGLDASKREAVRLTRAAHNALDALPRKSTTRLREIANHLLVRRF